MVKEHIHKYRRVNVGKKKLSFVMQCADPECNHSIHMITKLSAPALIGKASICNRCESIFILDKRAIRMALPCCENCVHVKKIDKHHKLADADAFFETLEKKMGVSK